jgi:NAD(P)-dependent dehydrogenase (short-subunit alcohol dehydrogenase family)
MCARASRGTSFLSSSSSLRNSWELGPIDIVIANAGHYSFGPTWELSEEQWEETVNVDLKGVWITCKVVIPQMLPRRRGKFICIGSTGNFKGLPGLGHYTAAKHGVVGLMKTLAIELAPYNINVNAVCPTTVDTTITNNSAFFEYFAGGPGSNGDHSKTGVNRLLGLSRILWEEDSRSRGKLS